MLPRYASRDLQPPCACVRAETLPFGPRKGPRSMLAYVLSAVLSKIARQTEGGCDVWYVIYRCDPLHELFSRGGTAEAPPPRPFRPRTSGSTTQSDYCIVLWGTL